MVSLSLSVTRGNQAEAEVVPAGMALDIPERPEGGNGRGGGGKEGEANVSTLLEEARKQIIAAGGEDKAVETLRDYRLGALWVSRGSSPTTFRWVRGFSFSSHEQARKSGITIEEFTANPKKTRQTRKDAGNKGTR